MTKGRYYRIRPSFWQDPKVRNQWTEDMRMLALYLTTSPHRNMVVSLPRFRGHLRLGKV